MARPLSRRMLFQKSLLACAGLTALDAQHLWAMHPADDVRSAEPVTIRTVGTGAADHDWKRLGEPGVRGSACTLIDGHILIDCGTTGSANLVRFSIDPHTLTDLVITHSHDDHFNVSEIRKVLDGRSPDQPPMGLWASPQALTKLNQTLEGRFIGHALVSGTAFDIGRLRFTALPANHLLSDPTEQALHFLIETPCGNLLYALDGAWMLKRSRQLIGQKHLDMIIWDATMSETGDFRIFEHNDLLMISQMMRALKTTKAVNAKTVCILNHIARTLWPADLNQAERLAAERGWILAADGMTFELR